MGDYGFGLAAAVISSKYAIIYLFPTYYQKGDTDATQCMGLLHWQDSGGKE
jgi:hypothetical protein